MKVAFHFILEEENLRAQYQSEFLKTFFRTTTKTPITLHTKISFGMLLLKSLGYKTVEKSENLATRQFDHDQYVAAFNHWGCPQSRIWSTLSFQALENCFDVQNDIFAVCLETIDLNMAEN